MVVQHNLTALNANRHYGINQSKLASSLEKLSSGYAINRAGDNAAGLAVSEKMRSQIAGLTQGVKNAQDGISMIQTYEGALTETDNILQRMKTLASQSANGTYQDDVDRDAIQLEFDQLNDELNQIADTDYNGVVALNGGVMSDGTVANNTGVISDKPKVQMDKNGNANAAIVYSENVRGTVDSAGNGSININGVRVELSSGKSFSGNDTVNGTAGAYKPDDAGKAEGSSYTVTGFVKGANGEWDATKAKITAVEKFKIGDKDTSITINGKSYTVARTTTGKLDGLVDASGNTVKNNSVLDGFKVQVSGSSIVATSEYTLTTAGVIRNTTSTDTKKQYDVGMMEESEGVSTSNSYQHGTINMTYAKDITLQVGARGKDSVNFNFAYTSNGIGDLKSDMDCSARGLGTDQLSLNTQESANFAIDKIDNAINKVSMVRGTFGAIQNRMEHKIDNMNVTKENMTSAESGIRDTQMDQEMMKFTSANILAQASQSMLAQANQLPQGVLQLLG